MQILNRFWNWYEKHYTIYLTISTLLFTLQIIHLIWMTTHVVSLRLLGKSLFPLSQELNLLIAVADYTEVPALLATGIVYWRELQKKHERKNLLYLFFIASQFLHIFWITDEIVLEQYANPIALPGWLAWIAICIDYLELPVIIETAAKWTRHIKDKIITQV